MSAAPSGDPRATCGQCGAEIRIPPAGGLVTCEFCAAPLYVEAVGTVRHFLYRPAVQADEVAGHIGAWLFAGGQTQSVTVTATRVVYYPFWRVTRGARVELHAAAASPEVPLTEIASPSGELVPFDASLTESAEIVGAASAPPPAPEAGAADADGHREVWLVHVPVYHTTYEISGREETVIVESTADQVIASSTPPGTIGLSSSTDGLLLWGGLAVLLITGVALPWDWVALASWGVVGTAALLLLGRRSDGEGRR